MPANGRVQGFGVFEQLQLFVRRLGLVVGFPLGVRHAVDGLDGFVLAHLGALVFGGGEQPFIETVAAESRQVHEVVDM